ncbi:hypothetical protein B0A54_16286 [Friedmanniomyces endolithicus]|uniref:FAD dependent oxidoreductase domain-containing protein n=1 Tax=Friedmanniomyces endolithicus TaxID=329885 RepID=A0A4U0U4E4_9PEZI|nr:hypothetical protein LTS09_009919 [Friedmanniomyces endolithicus]KAK0310461.1 hypothetical protein LTR01_003613 [Friedmanniomyces endolithicus]KAK0828044.1 hypothetical protein LTR73_004997 [Friedmanniomyces endolithicus]TKA29402.1 hypothetical protein B0A54_16286 [Friedmanniomyces endolithicus]
MPQPKSHVLVIGAGVTGLTSAVFLAEAGYAVTVIAAHVPGDSSIEYTSPWAGAHWHTHATPEDPRACDWDVQTYEYWVGVLEREGRDEKLPRAGLKLYDSFKYWDFPVKERIWWAPYVKDYRVLADHQESFRSINERTPEDAGKIQAAVAYRAVAVNVPQYLLYLQERARKADTVVIKARLPVERGLQHTLEAAEQEAMNQGRSKVVCFVNATGLGAAKLCGDEAMYPIRGQTVLVKGEAKTIFTRSGVDYGAYCIPRPGSGSTILGGTKEKDVWSETPDPEVTEQILKHAALNIPELMTGPDGGFEVISVQCGLRPGRYGGARVEIERVGGKRVVHAYGHAGGGYQNSVGSARLTLRLVEESLASVPVGARL